MEPFACYAYFGTVAEMVKTYNKIAEELNLFQLKGSTTREVVESYFEVQGKRYLEGEYPHVTFDLNSDANRTEIKYVTTSETVISLSFPPFVRNDWGHVCRMDVQIPEDRAKPGRWHYEVVTYYLSNKIDLDKLPQLPNWAEEE